MEKLVVHRQSHILFPPKIKCQVERNNQEICHYLWSYCATNHRDWGWLPPWLEFSQNLVIHLPTKPFFCVSLTVSVYTTFLECYRDRVCLCRELSGKVLTSGWSRWWQWENGLRTNTAAKPLNVVQLIGSGSPLMISKVFLTVRSSSLNTVLPCIPCSFKSVGRYHAPDQSSHSTGNRWRISVCRRWCLKVPQTMGTN